MTYQPFPSHPPEVMMSTVSDPKIRDAQVGIVLAVVAAGVAWVAGIPVATWSLLILAGVLYGKWWMAYRNAKKRPPVPKD